MRERFGEPDASTPRCRLGLVGLRAQARRVHQVLRAVSRRRREGLQGRSRAVARQPDVPRERDRRLPRAVDRARPARARRWRRYGKAIGGPLDPAAVAQIVAWLRAQGSRRTQLDRRRRRRSRAGPAALRAELPEVPRRRRRRAATACTSRTRGSSRSRPIRSCATRSSTAGRARRWSRGTRKLTDAADRRRRRVRAHVRQAAACRRRAAGADRQGADRSSTRRQDPRFKLRAEPCAAAAVQGRSAVRVGRSGEGRARRQAQADHHRRARRRRSGCASTSPARSRSRITT